MAMPPEMVSLSEGPDILLDKPIMLLGRHHECDIQLNSRKVSRRHCCIAQVQDFLVVRDLQSTNGIRINGEKVLEGRLNPGDELTVGNFSYKIRWHGHPSQPVSEGEIADRPENSESEILTGKPGDASQDSREEPVALRDSVLGPAADVKVAKASSEKDSSAERKRLMEDMPPSLILPDNLDLRPFSDEVPNDKKDA